MKLRKITKLLLCCVVAYDANAQDINLEWAHGVGSATSYSEESRGTTFDKEGNVITTGRFRGTVDFDPGSGTEIITSIRVNGINTFIQKVDKNGTLVWAKAFKSDSLNNGLVVPGYSGQGEQAVSVDHNNNIYVTGYFTKTVNFDVDLTNVSLTSTLAANSTTSYNENAYISRLNPDGSLAWVKHIGGTARSYGVAVTNDANGYVYGLGHFYSLINTDITGNGDTLLADNQNNTYIVKYDTSGNLIWSKLFVGESIGITTDILGNVYISGVYRENASYGTNPQDTFGTGIGQNMYIAKLDSTGNVIWAKGFHGGETPQFMSVASYPANVKVDKEQNVFFSGKLMNIIDFDPGPDKYELTPLSSIYTSNNVFFSYSADGFITKLDSAGNLLWVSRFGKESKGILPTTPSNACVVFDLELDAAGDVYATGTISGTIDFDPDSTTAYELTSSQLDNFLLKCKSDGKMEWVEKIGGAGVENAYGIDLDGLGNIVIAGYFQGRGTTPSDFAIAPDSFKLNANGTSGTDIFVAKYFECIHFTDNSLGNITGADSVCIGNTQIYTAYIPGAATYTWTLPNGWTGSSTSNTIAVQVNNDGGIVSVIGNGFCDTSIVYSKTVELSIPKVFITVNGYELSTSRLEYDSWQWYLNGAPINGADDTKYTVTQNGVYSVVVSGGDNCTDSASYTVSNYDVSINDVNGIAQQIYAYPNPANDILHIKSPVAVSLSLANIAGKVIRSTSTASELSLKGLADGIYFLRVADKEGRLIKVEKVVKTH